MVAPSLQALLKEDLALVPGHSSFGWDQGAILPNVANVQHIVHGSKVYSPWRASHSASRSRDIFGYMRDTYEK